MITVENIKVFNLEGAIRGMRNPLNSWDGSDSIFGCSKNYSNDCLNDDFINCDDCSRMFIGKNDMDLMRRLYKAGTEHRKYARQIFVSMDINAPLYWWKEFDTYKVGTTSNSCSTMHKIHEKEFILDDFSFEHCKNDGIMKSTMEQILWTLNKARNRFLETKDKQFWWDMIQLLPSSYNQKRTITMTYENVFSMIHQRKNHKLDEWVQFVEVLKGLPLVKEITECEV